MRISKEREREKPKERKLVELGQTYMLPILEGKPDGGGGSWSLAEAPLVSAFIPISCPSATGGRGPGKEPSPVLVSEASSLLSAYSSSICVVVLLRAWSENGRKSNQQRTFAEKLIRE